MYTKHKPDEYTSYIKVSPDDIQHFGIAGMKWGQRRYQNKDGSYTAAGKERYGIGDSIKKAAESVGKSVSSAADSATSWVKKAASDTGKWVSKAASDTQKAVSGAVSSITKKDDKSSETNKGFEAGIKKAQEAQQKKEADFQRKKDIAASSSKKTFFKDLAVDKKAIGGMNDFDFHDHQQALGNQFMELDKAIQNVQSLDDMTEKELQEYLNKMLELYNQAKLEGQVRESELNLDYMMDSMNYVADLIGRHRHKRRGTTPRKEVVDTGPKDSFDKSPRYQVQTKWH